jgi:hypothetical protein
MNFKILHPLITIWHFKKAKGQLAEAPACSLLFIWKQTPYAHGCIYNSSMPFYKFGDLMFLEKIKKEDWIKFIVKRFKDTKK